MNRVLQQVYEIGIDPNKIEQLMQMIVRGLYRHHSGKVLSREMWWPDVQMIRPPR